MAHACLVVTDHALASPSGPFSWSRIAPTPFHSEGESEGAWWCELHYAHPGVSQRLTHRRQVVLVRGQGIIVCDWLEGGVTSGIAVHWPLTAGRSELRLSGTTLAALDYCITWGTTMGEVHGSVDPTQRSPRYGQSCEAALLRLDYSGPLPTALVTCFGTPARPLRMQRSAIDAVRVLLAADESDDAATLVMRPGASPAIERAPMHASSQRVNS